MAAAREEKEELGSDFFLSFFFSFLLNTIQLKKGKIRRGRSRRTAATAAGATGAGAGAGAGTAKIQTK